jgi:hypothetical protein
MIESSCKAQATFPPQDYPNSLKTHKYCKTPLSAATSLDERKIDNSLGDRILAETRSAEVCRGGRARAAACSSAD